MTEAHWIKAHPASADRVFGDPIHRRLMAVRDGLSRHGYTLRLDVGKRSVRATVTRPGLRAKSSYGSLESFMHFEEDRLREMDKMAAPPPLTVRG